MISFLLSIIPAPWLVILKGLPWKLIDLCVSVALIAFLAWRVLAWHQFYSHGQEEIDTLQKQLAAEQDCLAGTACAIRQQNLAIEGERAVTKALADAQEAAAAAQAERDRQHAAEAARLRAAASVAQKREFDYRRRLEAAIASPTGECRRWAEEAVPCPIE